MIKSSRDEWKEFSDSALDAINEAPTPYVQALIFRAVYQTSYGPFMHGDKRCINIFFKLRPIFESGELLNQTMETSDD